MTGAEILTGTVVNVTVDHLPGDRAPKLMWLWCSDPVAAGADLDWWWRSYLRRFDLEHTFRFLKQTLGLTRPRLRTGEQADRWVWLLITAYTQLRLARDLATDLRRPWEPPLPPERLTPGRVRRGFPRIHRAAFRPKRRNPPDRDPVALREPHPRLRHAIRWAKNTRRGPTPAAAPNPQVKDQVQVTRSYGVSSSGGPCWR